MFFANISANATPPTYICVAPLAPVWQEEGRGSDEKLRSMVWIGTFGLSPDTFQTDTVRSSTDHVESGIWRYSWASLGPSSLLSHCCNVLTQLPNNHSPYPPRGPLPFILLHIAMPAMKYSACQTCSVIQYAQHTKCSMPQQSTHYRNKGLVSACNVRWASSKVLGDSLWAPTNDRDSHVTAPSINGLAKTRA